jgi:hypothetical protein
MAKDYLAIPASSTDAERVFSFANLIGTDRRNALSMENFEAVQVLRSAYASGALTVSDMSKHKLRYKVLN